MLIKNQKNITFAENFYFLLLYIISSNRTCSVSITYLRAFLLIERPSCYFHIHLSNSLS